MTQLTLILLSILGLAVPAGADYGTGHAAFQRGDYATALRVWTSLAKQGEATAQYSLGILHASGLGVPQSYADAAIWFRQAAEQGYGEGQFNLGLLYARGHGIAQDKIRAYMWLDLAARQGVPDAARGRDVVASQMQKGQLHEAQAMLRNWRPRSSSAAVRPPSPTATGPTHPSPSTIASSPPPQLPKAKTAEPESRLNNLQVSSAGTGFFVSSAGHMLTNYHVIDECEVVAGRHGDTQHILTVLASDPENDLALLLQATSPPSFATFRTSPDVRPGDGVIVVGFPLRGLLASEAQITTGTVSALAGIRDDPRFLQMTAPVQPGNSGGPLLDQSGNLVGVVASKLDAALVQKKMGDIPQNVNFAIKASIARQFLEKQQVSYAEHTSAQELKAADVGDRGKTFTFVVECWK